MPIKIKKGNEEDCCDLITGGPGTPTSRLVFNVVSAPPVYMSFSRNLGRPHAILKHTPETVARFCLARRGQLSNDGPAHLVYRSVFACHLVPLVTTSYLTPAV